MSFHLRLLVTPLVSFGHCVVCPSSIYGFWLPLWYLLTIVLCILLLITPLVSVDHCIVYPSFIYCFWLPLWYLFTIVLCILLLITPLVYADHSLVYLSSDYLFRICHIYIFTFQKRYVLLHGFCFDIERHSETLHFITRFLILCLFIQRVYIYMIPNHHQRPRKVNLIMCCMRFLFILFVYFDVCAVVSFVSRSC
jgi:hypothetical protein